jgi:hypothetical protein
MVEKIEIKPVCIFRVQDDLNVCGMLNLLKAERGCSL